jgi:predicted GNAT superfamily acetyltransferase
MSVQIKLVENIDQMAQLSDFFQDIWANGPEVVPFDIGYAIVHVGGYAALAFEGSNVVGASFGVRGVHNGKNILHSHVTASRIPGIGFDLKQHQFAWAKQQGIQAITWTFDPLVRRNCAFNLDKLGAQVIEFLPNFYGVMTDDINAGDVSDRLFAYWSITPSGYQKISQTENVALANHDGHPQIQDFNPKQSYAIYLPEDIEALRKSNLGLVQSWRTEVHNLLSQAFEQGARINQMIDNRQALLITPS